MNYDFKKISIESFEKEEAQALFNNPNNRSFAVLVFGNEKFKFGWDSDQLDPIITPLRSGHLGIGVDQDFVIVSEIGLLFSMNFVYPLCEIIEIDNNIILATELEIFVIDAKQFKVRDKFDLDDVYSTLLKRGDSVEITKIDNKKIKFKL